MVLEINDQTFDSEVLNSTIPVVVDFWAPWCNPCRALAPRIEKLADEFIGKGKFCKINVDDNPQMSEKYQVTGIPLVIFFKNGEQNDTSIGLAREEVLKSKLEPLV